jgi:beta-lactamase class D
MIKCLACICFGLASTSSALGQPGEIVRDFSKQYGKFSGAFVLYDESANQLTRHNPNQCAHRYSPASTFKILNSLIGLQTGVIKDKDFVIPWDGITRNMPEWNRDHTLESAVRFSVVPYFQELARRVGEKRMKLWVDSVGYGNCDIAGGIDRFWLGSTLTISANEQVGFLRRLWKNDLPFAPGNLEMVRNILILEKGPNYVLRGKTGFSTNEQGVPVGWFVGTLEREGKKYFFASNAVGERRDADEVFDVRKSVALAILEELKLLPAASGSN